MEKSLECKDIRIDERCPVCERCAVRLWARSTGSFAAKFEHGEPQLTPLQFGADEFRFAKGERGALTLRPVRLRSFEHNLWLCQRYTSKIACLCAARVIECEC